MKRLVIALAAAAALALSSAGVTLADNPHSGGSTGQPSQSCQATNPPAFPGNTANAPGSAFNGSAGSQYAGSQPQNSNNPNSVAQYDVACFQQTQH